MNNNNSREDQWLQHYEQHQIQEMMTPCFNGVNMTTLTSELTLGDGGATVVGRRSRASSRRAIPTTLLNANPSNFRALVQKFTGRSAGGESHRKKGPVTLDFASPAKVSKELDIFPVTNDVYRHVSNEKSHVTEETTRATTSFQASEEHGDHGYGHVYDDHEHDYDLIREYSGNSSYDGFDQMDYYHDTTTLEEFMMTDFDL